VSFECIFHNHMHHLNIVATKIFLWNGNACFVVASKWALSEFISGTCSWNAHYACLLPQLLGRFPCCHHSAASTRWLYCEHGSVAVGRNITVQYILWGRVWNSIVFLSSIYMYVYVITYILIYYTVASSVNSLCEAYVWWLVGWFALHLYIPAVLYPNY